MTTFDQVLTQVKEALASEAGNLQDAGEILINRDLKGKIRLIVKKIENRRESERREVVLDRVVADLFSRLGPHGYPPGQGLLVEENMDAVQYGAPCFCLSVPGLNIVRVVDRVATDTDWTDITSESSGKPRVVFFSIKGGVGRSTALSALAWALADAGKKVMVLDLDLESPGLSTALLPPDRRPLFGIADWLVEDLVDNGDAVIEHISSRPPLMVEGDILVIPAHGNDPGDYISKLGRVWMAKTTGDGTRELWSQRLLRLLEALEEKHTPDIVLIDSRAGIDEVAASCITHLGAERVFLFAFDGDQTWSGYKILFQNWVRANCTTALRDRLQMVGAMIPGGDSRVSYFEGLRENAYSLFSESFYEAVPPGETVAGRFSFEESDEEAPHFPLPIRWSEGWTALRTMHGRLSGIDREEVNRVFGPLLEDIKTLRLDAGEVDG